MASKMVHVSGSYDKHVEDSGDGCGGASPQSKAKFSNPITTPKASGKQAQQSANEPMDSGTGKGHQGAEGGSKTTNK